MPANPKTQVSSRLLQLPPEIQEMIVSLLVQDEVITILEYRKKPIFTNTTILATLSTCQLLRKHLIIQLRLGTLTLRDTRPFSPSLPKSADMIPDSIVSCVSKLMLELLAPAISSGNYRDHFSPFSNLRLLLISVPAFGVAGNRRTGVLGAPRHHNMRNALSRVVKSEFQTAQETEDLERLFDFHLNLWLSGLNNDEGLTKMIWDTKRGFMVHFRFLLNGRIREMVIVFDADTGKIVKREEIGSILCRRCGLRHVSGDDNSTLTAGNED